MEMPLFIPQLMLCPGMPGSGHKYMLCHLPSSANAAEGARHRGDSGLEEKSIHTICSHSQLNSQPALCIPEPLMQLQDVCPCSGHQLSFGWESF